MPDNLSEPVDGLHLARGRFSQEAKNKAVTLNSGLPEKITLALAGVALVALYKRFRQ